MTRLLMGGRSSRIVGAAAAFSLMLTACGSGSGVSSGSVRIPEDPHERTALVERLETFAFDEVRKASGALDALGAAAPEVFARADRLRRETLRAALAATSPGGATPLGALGGRPGALGTGAALFAPRVALVPVTFASAPLISVLVEGHASSAVDRAEADGEPVRSELPGQTVERDGMSSTTTTSVRVEGGRVVAEVTIEMSVPFDTEGVSGTIRETAKATASVGLCPDGAGRTNGEFTMRITSGLEARGGGRSTTGSGGLTVEATGTGQTDDSASLAELDVASKGTLGAAGPKGSASVAGMAGATYRGGPGGEGLRIEGIESSITSTRGSGLNAQGFADLLAQLPAMVLSGLFRRAEAAWRNGYCVVVEVREGRISRDQGGGLSASLETRERMQIEATVRHKIDGGELALPIAASYTGQGTLSPTQPVTAPAIFSYVAPGNEAWEEVSLRTVSRRGIGEALITIIVGLPGYAVEYDGEWRYRGTKCGGPAGVWEIGIHAPGASGTVRIDLDEETLTGPARSVYTAGGIVKYVLRGAARFIEGDPPQLHIDHGTGTAKGPFGTQAVAGGKATIPLRKGC